MISHSFFLSFSLVGGFQLCCRSCLQAEALEAADDADADS